MVVRRANQGREIVALRSDSVSSLYSAALAGAGIALLPRAVADRDAALVRIDTSTAPEPRVIWQAVHADQKESTRSPCRARFFDGDPGFPGSG